METAGSEETPEDAERKGLGTPAPRRDFRKLVKPVLWTEEQAASAPKKGINLIAVLPEV
jgi:DNA topoisomerase-3